MFQEFFAKSPLLAWPLAGLLIFVTIFAGVLAYVVFGLKDRNKIDEIAALPLADDEFSSTNDQDGKDQERIVDGRTS